MQHLVEDLEHLGSELVDLRGLELGEVHRRLGLLGEVELQVTSHHIVLQVLKEHVHHLHVVSLQVFEVDNGLFAERVLVDLLPGYPILGVQSQHSPDQVVHSITLDRGFETELLLLLVLHQFSQILPVPGCLPIHHLI